MADRYQVKDLKRALKKHYSTTGYPQEAHVKYNKYLSRIYLKKRQTNTQNVQSTLKAHKEIF